MKKADWVITLIGVTMLGIGLFMTKTIENAQGILLTLPYVLVGTGCGILGYGMSNIVSKKAISKDLDLERQLEIEKNDERNIAISTKSKAKAYDLMTFLFGVLMLSFALMNIDMTVILLLVAAYLSVHIYGIYYRIKYEKEM